MKKQIKFGKIIETRISAINFNECVSLIEEWIENKVSNYVCICNTHSLVTASENQDFKNALDNAGLCTPDGVPLVWALKMYGYKGQERVDGPNLMLELCKKANDKEYKVFLYGGENERLKELKNKLEKKYRNLNIVGAISPPFRKLSKAEEDEYTKVINNSNADLIFISLGCPKQELWMYQKKNKINGVMLGVGAAFEFINGNIKRPPVILQKSGFEWLYRLISEPKRLWKRYLYNNPVYIYKFIGTYKKNKKFTLNKNL
ncbi:WecB/TagA/CpsF family glycosyltransferase [Metabacillus idriensis]|uniref:WecB/TagA/CpsF family glycosyltransferase n=1 Tax=Metabacillus idriensis TaxID=324768 RepID=UPI001CD3B548|nr:WecB/TagA/CpsF family glycosyltransferase [Metabacillus idriensis]